MKRLLFLSALLYGYAVSADDLTEQTCQSANGITPICGFLSPEDIDVLPGGNALVVGGFSLDNKNGDIRALHLADQRVEIIYTPEDPTVASDKPPWGDPACPGPPQRFAAHGIHVSQRADGTTTLLVVNHTGRESVEWFEISETNESIAATWRGCVIVDTELWINDVAMLPGGGFVASQMMPRGSAATMFDRPPNDKLETGYVVQWHTDRGWQKIPGTAGALPNGIQVSADGNTIYNNHYLANQVVAIARASGKRLWTTPVLGAPDNMSISEDGTLLVTMHLASLREIRDVCMRDTVPFCGLPFAVAYIEPERGEVTPIIQSAGAPFGGATVAVETGNAIYLGAFAGNRIARIAKPSKP